MPSKPPDPGRLRQRIAFQRPSDPEDGQRPSGAVEDLWHTVAERWAWVNPLSGRELFNAQQSHPDVNGEIWARYFPGPDESWRAMFGGRPLNFTAVVNWEERNQWWYILYTEPK